MKKLKFLFWVYLNLVETETKIKRMSLLCISGYSPIGHVIGRLQLSSEQHDIVSESSQSEEQEAITFVGSVKSN